MTFDLFLKIICWPFTLINLLGDWYDKMTGWDPKLKVETKKDSFGNEST